MRNFFRDDSQEQLPAARRSCLLFGSAAILPALLLGLVSGDRASATVLLQENFSTTTGGTFSSTIPGSQFKVTGGNVDVIGVLNGGFFSCQDNYSGNCLDMIGNMGFGSIGSIPTFTLVAGDTYTITFGVVAQALSTSLDFSVGLGSLSAVETAPYAAPAHLTVTFTPTVTQSGAALTFASITNVNNVNGPVLDNIMLTETTGSSTPEPTSTALVLTGLLASGGGAFRLRRRTA